MAPIRHEMRATGFATRRRREGSTQAKVKTPCKGVCRDYIGSSQEGYHASDKGVLSTALTSLAKAIFSPGFLQRRASSLFRL